MPSESPRTSTPMEYQSCLAALLGWCDQKELVSDAETKAAAVCEVSGISVVMPLRGCGLSPPGHMAHGEFFLLPGVCGRSGLGRKDIRGCALTSVYWSGFQNRNTKMTDSLPVLPKNDSSKSDSYHSSSPYYARRLCELLLNCIFMRVAEMANCLPVSISHSMCS